MLNVIGNIIGRTRYSGGYIPEYQRVLSRAAEEGIPEPSSQVKTAQNKFMKFLVDRGILAKRLFFYVFSQDVDERFGYINWVDPSTFYITKGGSPIWSALVGTRFSGAGTTDFYNTHFNPSVHGGSLYQLNSASIDLYLASNNAIIGRFDFGVMDGSNSNTFSGFNVLRATGGLLEGNINRATNRTSGGTITSSIGMWYFERTADAEQNTYQNNALVAQETTNDTVKIIPNGEWTVGIRNGVGGASASQDSNRFIGLHAVGAPLTNQERQDLIDGHNTYLADINEPTEQTEDLVASDFGETSVTITADSPGNGTGRLFAISTSPILVNPSDGIIYSADANFGDGDEVSTGVYVVKSDNLSSVNITGLSEGTYYIKSWEYKTSVGGLRSYCKLLGGGNPINFQFSDFEFGNLESLHPEESYEQIKSRRLLNWDKFKTRVNSRKAAGTDLTLNGERLELFFPQDDTIDIGNTESVSVVGGGVDLTDIVVFPLAARNIEEWVFSVASGGAISFTDLTFSKPDKNRFEVYLVTLRKGGDSKLIEILGSVRPDFWDHLLAGKRLYYGWALETNDTPATVASWNSITKTITLNEDITEVGDDTSGPFVAIALYFNEEVSASDFSTYGGFWNITDPDTSETPSINLLKSDGTDEGLETQISVEDSKIINFYRGIQVNSRNCSFTLNGNNLFQGSMLGIGFFGDNTLISTLTFTNTGTLTINDCGYIIKGGNVTANNILGGGGYLHPNTVVTSQNLVLTNNKAAAFRQYSASGPKPVEPEWESNYTSVVASGNGEFDLLTSDSMPTIIGSLSSAGKLQVGGLLTVNTGTLNIIRGNNQAQPPSSLADFSVIIKNATIGGDSVFGYSTNRMVNLTMRFEDCTWYSKPNTEVFKYIGASTDGMKRLEMIRPKYLYDSESGVTQEGNPAPVYAADLIALQRMGEVYLEDPEVGAFHCILFGGNSLTENLDFTINNPNIQCERLSSSDLACKSVLTVGNGIEDTFSGTINLYKAAGFGITAAGVNVVNESYTGDAWSVEFDNPPADQVDIVGAGTLRQTI